MDTLTRASSDLGAAHLGTAPIGVPAGRQAAASAVSWAAILAGAAVAVAVSLLLITLGGGIGIASLSPWRGASSSLTSFTVATAIGLIVVQWVSAGLGGYITGRLRTKWPAVHTHEVFFRDTAHGLITWALATLLVSGTAAVIASQAIGAGLRAASGVAAGAAAGATGGAASGANGGAANAAVPSTAGVASAAVDAYDVDTLLRAGSEPAASAAAQNAAGSDVRGQIARILARALAAGGLSDDDRNYLTQLVSAQTGLSQADAQMRVDAMAAKIEAAGLRARTLANDARKSAEAASIFTALAMLVGAFIACISAALGGRLRDLHP
jgi:hypothetical protein